MRDFPLDGPLLHATDNYCLLYATHDWFSSTDTFRFKWQDHNCDVEAPFACTNNGGIRPVF